MPNYMNTGIKFEVMYLLVLSLFVFGTWNISFVKTIAFSYLLINSYNPSKWNMCHTKKSVFGRSSLFIFVQIAHRVLIWITK